MRAGAQSSAALDPLVHSLTEACSLFLSGLHAALPREVPAPASAVDVTQANKLIAEPDALLERDDVRAVRLFSEHAGVLRVVLGASADPVENCIGSFEFDRALELLRACAAGGPQDTRDSERE